MSFSDFLSDAGDTLLTGVGAYIDKETREEPVVVQNPTPVHTTENTGASGQPGTYQAGTTQQPTTVAGMPWERALLFGSLGLLGLGLMLKLVKS